MANRNKPNIHWTPQKVDESFDEIMKELARTPRANEFGIKYPGAFALTIQGRYSPDIKTWNQYLASRGIELNHDVKKWNTKSVDEAFDAMKKELGRTPKSDEFRNGGLLGAIREGRYSPQIKTWNQYLEHRGLEASRINWTPEKVDEVFDKMRKKIGKTPGAIPLRKIYPGAMSFITEGRYHPNIKTWNQYLEHRGIEVFGWTPEKIDEAFDEIREKIGKNPTYEEFKVENSGAISAIAEGRYDKSVKRWSEYVAYRQNGNKISEKRSEKEQIESLLEGFVNGK